MSLSTDSSASTAIEECEPQQGDVVWVRSAQEIFRMLDANGCLGGLPFMAEMLPFCGRKFRVERIANKTCVNSESVFIGSLTDCVVLRIPNRCDGSAHGGCQMSCKFLWRTEWLRREPEDEKFESTQSLDEVKEWLQQRAHKSQQHYRCQATELVNIAEPTSAYQVGQYLRDVSSGVPASQVVQFVAGLAIKKLSRKSDSLSGPCEGRTPTVSLGLKVGDRVRVKSLSQIRETLDQHGCNRGLWYEDAEMSTYCGQDLVVSRVLHRLIDEKTGQLKELKHPCIVLAESECSGVFRRFCARGMLHFWREIWLEKIE